MKKFMMIMSLLITSLVSCKKNENKAMINATVYFENDREKANIAFLEGQPTEILNSELTVAAYFNSLSSEGLMHKKNTDQFSGYFKAGTYTILVQLPANSLYTSRSNKYSYKVVTISENNPSNSNVMVFKSDVVGYYQPWLNKY